MKVKFIGCSEEQANYGVMMKNPNEFLEVGKKYELERKEVHDWYTKYFLKEFPGKAFNSVCFE